MRKIDGETFPSVQVPPSEEVPFRVARIGKTALVALLLLVVGLASYSNSVKNQFLYDDEHYIQRNPFVRDFTHLKEVFTSNVGAGVHRPDNFYRPLQILLYTAIFHFSGLHVEPYHVVNVIVHTVNAFLIFILLNSLFGMTQLSLITSVLFLAHPVHTEAVTYINGTADPLAALFILLALVLRNRVVPGQLSPPRPVPRLSSKIKKNRSTESARLTAEPFFLFTELAVCLCFLAALLSKETAVVFPLLLIICDLARGRLKPQSSVRYGVPFAMLGIYMALRMTILNFTKSLNLFSAANVYTEHITYRFYTFMAALVEYWKVLLWPAQLKYDRPLLVFTSLSLYPVWLGVAISIGLLSLAWNSWRADRVLFCGILWFFAALGPVSGLVPINGFAMEHWLYIPSIGLFLAFSWGLIHLAKWVENACKLTPGRVRIGLACVVGTITGALVWRTYQRNYDWKEPIRFYTTILKHNPKIARVRNNLAMAFADQQRLEEAEVQYRAAIALDDHYPETHHNLARLLLAKGRVGDAVDELKRSLQIDPRFAYSHALLEEIYIKNGRRAEAEEEERVLKQLLPPK